MEKTATLNLRVNPTLKRNAEKVLAKLGIPMSTAIDMFLNQVVLNEGIPFNVEIPKPPKSVDISRMSDEELYEKIMSSLKNAKSGKRANAKEAIEEFRKKHV